MDSYDACPRMRQDGGELGQFPVAVQQSCTELETQNTNRFEKTWKKYHGSGQHHLGALFFLYEEAVRKKQHGKHLTSETINARVVSESHEI